MQNTDTVLMIRPNNFGYNPQTAVNNAFQKEAPGINAQEAALREFDGLVSVLQKAGVEVMVFPDTPKPYTPDSIFPNNWISFHPQHTICLYPMFAPNRRLERKPELIQTLRERLHTGKEIDFAHYEAAGLYLEGTGSMVLDRDHKIAYACLSPRTDEKVLEDFCQQMGYTPMIFRAFDSGGQPIYHTNVMMCVADKYVVICLESIPEEERKKVTEKIMRSGKEIIPISWTQVEKFAGNMLQAQNSDGEKLLVMSTQAFQSLSEEQISRLGIYNKLIHSPLWTIEANGGGSARCMIAEIFT
ncbi:MAG: amidinotransferase [Chitinophagaceae bacterium]|nr:amidinotransferase [Chitinophagaceae bacterium]MCW5927537.1 amidinotransferase [Chitinophagaceae bacterium]